MIFIDVISEIDRSITIGIHVHHHVFSEIDDISTVPSSFTYWWFFTITMDVSITWTVIVSPVIFSIEDTLVDFTVVKSSIIIGITFL